MHKRKGLILINAYSPTAETRQSARLKSELEKLGVTVTVRRNDIFTLKVQDGNITPTALAPLDYDFCIYLDKDKYAAEMLEKNGLRLFDRASTIELCDDKMLTHIALSGMDIPMPDTLPGLLCYTPDAPINASALDAAEKQLGYPMIVKESYGSLGKGVFKADDRAELESIAERVKLKPHLFQKYACSSHGKDMRVIVIGGKPIGAMLRISDGDFRSNIGLGAHAQKCDMPDDVADIASRAATALGADYCGIDFLLGDRPLLCEVNSNAFFDAFEAVTNINVAGIYARHICDDLIRNA